jgi:hypothetical protein
LVQLWIAEAAFARSSHFSQLAFAATGREAVMMTAIADRLIMVFQGSISTVRHIGRNDWLRNDLIQDTARGCHVWHTGIALGSITGR